MFIHGQMQECMGLTKNVTCTTYRSAHASSSSGVSQSFARDFSEAIAVTSFGSTIDMICHPITSIPFESSSFLLKRLILDTKSQVFKGCVIHNQHNDKGEHSCCNCKCIVQKTHICRICVKEGEQAKWFIVHRV